MHNVLIYTPGPPRSPVEAIRFALFSSGNSVACPDLEGPEDKALEALQQVFSGQLPDLLIADLSSNPDCMPVRRLDRLMRELWGDGAAKPLRLALLCPDSLGLPDWLAAADDFLLPPFSLEEALARIRLLLFRRRYVDSDHVLRFADITIDLLSGQAQNSAGIELSLRPREFELLRFLITHRGKFFSRTQLLDMVWSVDFEGGERTVDIHVRRLRAKLPESTADLLETRRGVGYGFRLPS